MPETLQSIVDKSIQLANNLGGPNAAYDEVAAEILLPSVYKQVILDSWKEPSKLQSFRKSKDVAFTAGVGPLPDGFLPEYAGESVLYKSTDPTVRTVYRRSFEDFRRAGYSKFGSFTIADGQILYSAAGAAFGAFTGSLQFVTFLIPPLPTSANDNLDIPQHMALEVIERLARALVGEPGSLSKDDDHSNQTPGVDLNVNKH